MRQADDFVRESRQQSASYSHSHVSLRLMSLNLSIERFRVASMGPVWSHTTHKLMMSHVENDISLRLKSLNLSIYIDFYLATVIISMEIFSIQCQERKENTKRKHKINRVVGGFVVFIATLQQKKVSIDGWMRLKWWFKHIPYTILTGKDILGSQSIWATQASWAI